MTLNNFTLKRKKKTRGCSFRIDEELLKVLDEESDKQGISVNALMNKILQQYSLQYRHMQRFGSVIVSRNIFSKIVNQCTEDEIKKIGEYTGSTETKDALRTLGISPTYNEVLKHVKNVGKFCGWFDFNQHNNEHENYVYLRHQLGKKWSIFLDSTGNTLFKSVLHKELKTEVFDNAVTIKTKKQPDKIVSHNYLFQNKTGNTKRTENK